MTKKFVTRALLIAGLITFGAASSFAQTAVKAKVRRVPPEGENKQPVAAATVIAQSKSSLNLTPAQVAKIDAMNKEVAALHAERARLWAEYKSIRARSDFNDAMAYKEAAPRMTRIVEINNQLTPIVARQQQELQSILNASQQAQVSTMVDKAKQSF